MQCSLRLLASFLTLVLLVAPVPAQQLQAPLVLHASSRLVVVNVVVHGRNGEPLSGLSKDDFEVFDNKDPQKITVFSEDSNRLGKTPGGAKAIPSLGPDIFSNRVLSAGEGQSGVTIVLLDALNTNIQDQSFARQKVIRFLRQIQPGDHIGLYALGAGLRVLHDFTTDASDLVAALNSYQTGALPATKGETVAATSPPPSAPAAPSSGLAGARGPSLSTSSPLQSGASGDPLNLANIYSLKGNGFEADYYLSRRIEATIRAIEFIADHLAAFPGRKNLIWVSGGFPLSVGFGVPNGFLAENRSQRDYAEEMKRCLRAVNAANMAIYPVDAGGVYLGGGYAGSSAARPGFSTLDIGNADQLQTMRTIAQRTGGKAFINRNDLDHAIADAIADSGVSYTLGFYPTQQAYDGSYHKLEIKLNQPHGDLRYRDGYVDFTKPERDQKSRMTDLQIASASPIDANGIGLTAQALPAMAAGKPAGPDALQLSVQIDPKTVSLVYKDGFQVGQLDVLFVQHDKEGRVVNVMNNTIDLKLGTDDLAKIRKFGILFRKDLTKAQATDSVRVVVRDVETGVLGTLTIPVHDLVAAK